MPHQTEKTVEAAVKTEEAAVQETTYRGPHMTGGDLKTAGNSGSPLRDALLDILALRGREALLSPHALEKELRKRGLGEVEIYRLCLLSRVRGYAQLVDALSGQYDVERFVYHALRETGLRRDVILDLAGTLASLSGHTVRAAGEDGVKPEVLSEGGGAAVFPLPVGFYQEELDGIRGDFQRAIQDGTAVSPDALARLRPLASAGIPEARYCLGAYLLRRASEEGFSSQEALDLLGAAAADGEPNAAAALGDYYYARREVGDWAEALRRYTGYGALALDDRRRIALVDILNQDNLNRHLFRYGAALLAVLALLFLVPAVPLYGVGWAWSLVYLLPGGGTLWTWFRRLQKEPYGEYYDFPAALLAAWTACWILRIMM